jgi:hypothetical protein
MAYYIHRCEFIRKTWLRILNSFLIFLIPIGAYESKKMWETFPNETKESYWKCLIEEIEIWKEGFKFGE